MGGFQAAGELAVVAVEGRRPGDEVANARRAFRAEDLDGVEAAEAGAGAQGVRDVLGDAVVVSHGGGDAALGVARVALGELCLGDQRDPVALAASSSAAMSPAMPLPTTMTRFIAGLLVRCSGRRSRGRLGRLSMRSSAMRAGAGDWLRHSDAVEDSLGPPSPERLEHPGEVAGVDAVHRGAGADRPESRQKMVCSGCWPARRCTRLISVPIAKVLARWCGGDGLDDVVGRAGFVGRVDDLHGALRMHDDAHAGIAVRALRRSVSTVKRLCTEQKPCQRMTRASSSVCGALPPSALRRIPHRHLLQRYAHGLGGVAAEVLVGEEEDPLAAFEGPLEHRRGVGGGADDAAVLAAERLQGGRGVHVGDGDDRRTAIRVSGAVP